MKTVKYYLPAMKTRKQKPEVGNLPGFKKSIDEQAKEEIAQPPEESNGFKKDRFSISFDLDADGTPDFSSMRDSNKEKVRQFLMDEKIRSAFGAKPASGTGMQMIHPAAVKGLYFTLGTIEAAVIPLFAKRITPQVARQVFIYSDAELAVLEAPTVAVLNKYAEWFLKWQDEIALATILSSLTIQKVQAALILSGMPSQAKSEKNTQKTEEDVTPQPN